MIRRRGLSSVVGAVFAIIALASTVGYITYSMNVLDNYNQSVLARNQQGADVVKEKFQISGVTLTGNKLNITVVNTGSLPVNFTKIWITNKSVTTTAWVKSYTPTNNLVAPGNTLANIGQNVNTWLNTNYPYHVKLVTSRGNTQEFDVTSAANSKLDIRLYALPPTVVTTFSTELVMFVINNSTNGATLTNITPQLIDQGGTAAVKSISGPTPSSYPTLLPGQSAYFKWDVSLSGNNGDSRLFVAQLANGIAGNTASTTVSILTVPISLQSGTSVQSLGLSGSNLPPNILELHKENNTTPANTRQMWAASAETSGTSIYTGWASGGSPQVFTWITNNDTTDNIVPAGSWVLSLRYVSDKVPSGFPAADLIYHFETLVATSADSSGNSENLSPTGNPTVQNTGVNGSRTIGLDGNSQYLSHAGIDAHSNVVNNLASTAGWFKTSGSIATQRSIFHIGNTAANPFYDISLTSAGKVVFSFSGKSSGSSATTCTSLGVTRYDDQNWHHFVAVKTSLNGCSLYIDNQVATVGVGTCIGTCNVAPPGAFYVGYDPTTANSNFPGTIDDIIHWNSAQLTSNQVQILTQKANYGPTAHTINVALERVDSTNTNVLQTINSGLQTATFPFYDPVTGGSPYNTGASSNYTTGNLGSVTFSGLNNGDRLRLKLNWSNGMNMSIREDDNTLSNPITSYLQVPNPTTVFPGYITMSVGSNPTLYVQNQGPNSAWFSSLTRIVYKPVNGIGTSYAAFINTVNNTYAVSPTRDGPLFKVGQTEVLGFYPPSDPACAKVAGDQCNSGFTIMPAGLYRMSAFLSGVDDSGAIFLRTVYAGPVKVQ